MAISKALERAQKKYKADPKNKDQLGYTALRRGGFNFALAYDEKKKGTKSYSYLHSDYAKEGNRYYNDLTDLTRYCVATLKELGASEEELKRLI